jgi:hypothetical protein
MFTTTTVTPLIQAGKFIVDPVQHQRLRNIRHELRVMFDRLDENTLGEYGNASDAYGSLSEAVDHLGNAIEYLDNLVVLNRR